MKEAIGKAERSAMGTVPQAARAAELHAKDRGYVLIAPKRHWFR